jgi:hypothetical protein
MNRVLFVCTAVALCSLTAHAQKFDQFKRQGSSEFFEDTTAGGIRIRKFVNRTYATASFFSPGAARPRVILLEQLFSRIERTDREGSEGQVGVVAWTTAHSTHDTRLWSIALRGNTGDQWRSYYRTILYGCCGAEDVATLFDIRDGKRIVTYSGSDLPAVLEVPNTGMERLFSFHSLMAAADPDPKPGSKNAIGVLTISASGGPLASYEILSTIEDQFGTPKILLSSPKDPVPAPLLTLWSSNHNPSPSAVTAFDVHVRITGEEEVIIPVRNDRLDAAGAHGSRQFSVRLLQEGPGNH